MDLNGFGLRTSMDFRATGQPTDIGMPSGWVSHSPSLRVSASGGRASESPASDPFLSTASG